MENLDIKIQNYIKLVYSEKSELNKILDLNDRKRMACDKVKLNFDEIQDIIHMKNEKVNDAIFTFLRTQNSYEFILLISDQHLFSEIMQRQMKPLAEDSEGKDTVMKDLELKTRMSKESELLLSRIKTHYRNIFLGEEEINDAELKLRLVKPEQRISKKSA